MSKLDNYKWKSEMLQPPFYPRYATKYLKTAVLEKKKGFGKKLIFEKYVNLKKNQIMCFFAQQWARKYSLLGIAGLAKSPQGVRHSLISTSSLSAPNNLSEVRSRVQQQELWRVTRG